MIEIGRVCIKIAGRDSNCKCVVVDMVDDRTVLIDGQTRRKKVNIKHIEPTKQKISIKKGASSSEVAKEFKKMGIELKEKKSKKPKERQKKFRKSASSEKKK